MSPVTFNTFMFLSNNCPFVTCLVRFRWLAGTDRRVFLPELEAELCVEVETHGSARDDCRCCQSVSQAPAMPGVVPNEAQAGMLISKG